MKRAAVHLFAPLLLGLLAPPSTPDVERPPRPAAELGLGLAVSVGVSLLASFWLVRWGTSLRFLSSDFHEYCSSTLALAQGNLHTFTGQRSVLAATPSALLSEALGLLDGMAVSALLACAAMALGLHAWGRAVHGPLAGVCAALAAFTMTPLVLLSRTLSYYPEMVAGFTLAAGATALALRFRTFRAVTLGAIGAAGCYLVDFRGLFWGLSFSGLMLLACLLPETGWRDLPGAGSRWLQRSLGKLTVTGVLHAVSYGLGRWSFPKDSTLEGTMDLRRFVQDSGFRDPDYALITGPPPATGYRWGSSELLDIPGTLAHVMREAALLPEAYWNTDQTQWVLSRTVTPWLGVWGGAAVLCLILVLTTGRERLGRLLALVGCAVPFLVAFKGAIEVQRGAYHYLAMGEPVMALVMGVAFVGLVDALQGLPWLRLRLDGLWSRVPAPRLRSWIRPALCFALALALLLGALPSRLSPAATWRERLYLHSDVESFVQAARSADGPTDDPTDDPSDERGACIAGLALEDEPEGRLYR